MYIYIYYIHIYIFISASLSIYIKQGFILKLLKIYWSYKLHYNEIFSHHIAG